MRIITEKEFSELLRQELVKPQYESVGSVTGPGRSGAIAAVYASHFLGVPFIPYKQPAPYRIGSLLIIDTAIQTGKTMRKAERFHKKVQYISLALYQEPPRVAFWYEAEKPQRYRHERIAA